MAMINKEQNNVKIINEEVKEYIDSLRNNTKKSKKKSLGISKQLKNKQLQNSNYHKKQLLNISEPERLSAYIRNFNEIHKLNFIKTDSLRYACSEAYLKELENLIINKETSHELSKAIKFIGVITYDGKENTNILGYVIKNIGEYSLELELSTQTIQLSQSHKTCITHKDLIKLLIDTKTNGIIQGAHLEIKENIELSKIESLKDLINNLIIKSDTIDKEDNTKTYTNYIGLGNLSKDLNVEYIVENNKQEKINRHKDEFKNHSYKH